MAEKKGGPCGCHREKERERERSNLQVKIGMLREYISILIDKMRGHRMPMPPAPYIPHRNPHIRQHESEYMPIHLGPANSWGYSPLNDWTRGPVSNQAPFQVSGYALGSSADQASLFIGPVAGHDANDGSPRRFLMTLLEMMITLRPTMYVVSLR